MISGDSVSLRACCCLHTCARRHANVHAGSAEAGDSRLRKEDKMDAKPGVWAGVWEEVVCVAPAFSDGVLNK